LGARESVVCFGNFSLAGGEAGRSGRKHRNFRDVKMTERTHEVVENTGSALGSFPPTNPLKPKLNYRFVAGQILLPRLRDQDDSPARVFHHLVKTGLQRRALRNFCRGLVEVREQVAIRVPAPRLRDRRYRNKVRRAFFGVAAGFSPASCSSRAGLKAAATEFLQGPGQGPRASLRRLQSPPKSALIRR